MQGEGESASKTSVLCLAALYLLVNPETLNPGQGSSSLPFSSIGNHGAPTVASILLLAGTRGKCARLVTLQGVASSWNGLPVRDDLRLSWVWFPISAGSHHVMAQL